MTTELPASLKATYAAAIAAYDALFSAPPSPRPDTLPFQRAVVAVLRLWTHAQTQISALALFSDNESVDDLTSAEIKYLSVYYYLGKTWEKRQPVAAQRIEERESSSAQLGGTREEDQEQVAVPDTPRAQLVAQAIDSYLTFLRWLSNYDLLAFRTGLTTEPLLSSRTVDAIKNPPGGRLTLKHILSAASGNGGGAESARAAKIARFRMEKELDAQLKAATERYTDNDADDTLRNLQIGRLQGLAFKALQALESLAMEQDLLARFPTPPSQLHQQHRAPQPFDKGYTERVESPVAAANLSSTNKAPLLNPTGKIMRPFTILPGAAPAATRRDIQSRVQGTGQHLPTMTVEEYLDEEVRRGGIIEGGGEASKRDKDVDYSSDEDDTAAAMRAADERTDKAREWDEFVEANPRGSGNTLNRG